jgi:hypothetical protein
MMVDSPMMLFSSLFSLPLFFDEPFLLLHKEKKERTPRSSKHGHLYFDDDIRAIILFWVEIEDE